MWMSYVGGEDRVETWLRERDYDDHFTVTN
jgi:hypothetical protein